MWLNLAPREGSPLEPEWLTLEARRPYPKAQKTHFEALEAHPQSLEFVSEPTMKSHLGTVNAQHGAVKAHLKSWRLNLPHKVSTISKGSSSSSYGARSRAKESLPGAEEALPIVSWRRLTFDPYKSPRSQRGFRLWL
jgi:hypothetical protein